MRLDPETTGNFADQELEAHYTKKKEIERAKLASIRRTKEALDENVQPHEQAWRALMSLILLYKVDKNVIEYVFRDLQLFESTCLLDTHPQKLYALLKLLSNNFLGKSHQLELVVNWLYEMYEESPNPHRAEELIGYTSPLIAEIKRQEEEIHRISREKISRKLSQSTAELISRLTPNSSRAGSPAPSRASSSVDLRDLDSGSECDDVSSSLTSDNPLTESRLAAKSTLNQSDDDD